MAKSATQTDKDVTLTFEVDGKEQTVTGDYLLVSVGRRPNTDLIGLNNTDVKLTDRGLIEVDDSYATPSIRYAPPSSEPITPPPTIIKCLGTSGSDKAPVESISFWSFCRKC